jgi:hypothetical protein
MLICTEAWSLAVMRRFVAALYVRTYGSLEGVPFTGDVEIDYFSLVVFHDLVMLVDRAKLTLTPEVQVMCVTALVVCPNQPGSEFAEAVFGA